MTCVKDKSLDRGFSLIEVMVALVVMSVGMLGMASLYVTSLRANGTAISRTQAVNLAADLAERIRANPGGQSAYAPTTAPTSDGNNCYKGTACTPPQLASDDLYIWGQQVTDKLPGSLAPIVTYTPGVNCNSSDLYSITLRWAEPTQSGLTYVLNFAITRNTNPAVCA